MGLLGHGRVENVMRYQVRAEEEEVGRARETVGFRSVVGHPEDGVAVAEGNAGVVPESEKPAKLFVGHVCAC
jgi:hypothetical protein